MKKVKLKMSCSLPVFASVQDANRVISILNNTSGEQENTGNFFLVQFIVNNNSNCSIATDKAYNFIA